jgi:hypothetical protein
MVQYFLINDLINIIFEYTDIEDILKFKPKDYQNIIKNHSELTNYNIHKIIKNNKINTFKYLIDSDTEINEIELISLNMC